MAIVIVLVLLTLAPPPKATGVRKTAVSELTVTGVLVDGVTGRPVALRKVRLQENGQEAGAATTDGEGRFRFESVAPEYMDPELEVDQPPRGFAPARRLDGSVIKVPLRGFNGRVLDLERLTVGDETLAVQTFAPVCADGRPSVVVPASPFVFLKTGFHLDRQWRLEPFAAGQREWMAPWKAVLCGEEKVEKTGVYIGGGPAFRTTWNVRVVRIPDGTTFTTTVTADAPFSTQARTGASGDPSAELLRWLTSGALQKLAIQGVLADRFTGKRLASRKVRVSRDGPEVVTGSQGEFRFDGVSGVHFMLEADAGAGSYRFVHQQDGQSLGLTSGKAKEGVITVGTVVVETDDANRAFGPVCDGARTDLLPAVELLVFEKAQKQGRGTDSWTRTDRVGISSDKWTPSGKRVLCIEEKMQTVGQYGSSRTATARRVTWKVRLVRLPEGTTVKTEVSADPSLTGNLVFGDSGDPTPALVSWLQTQR